MNYTLALLSHGDPDSRTAEATVESFREHVTPRPTTLVAYHDGPGYAYLPTDLGAREGSRETLVNQTWEATAGGPQLGYCEATRRLWTKAARKPGDYVFWLEHDFTFRRPVNLEELAFVLRIRRDVAQMSLMRDAVNEQEKQAGGLYESRPGQYRRRAMSRGMGTRESPSETFDWLEHTSYFTTNPSLMRAEFMRNIPWPTVGPACEGHFGRELAARDYSFGVWGEGEPWVTHIGQRTGKGY